jgi:hypothetical protein
MSNPIVSPGISSFHNPANSPDVPGLNVAYALMMALTNTSDSIVKQQVADSTTALNYGNLEQNLTSWWNSASGPLQAILTKMGQDAQGGNSNNDVSVDQSIFQALQGVSQSATGSANSLMQMANSQVSNDSTNLSAINSMAQNANWMAFLANLLAH